MERMDEIETEWYRGEDEGGVWSIESGVASREKGRYFLFTRGKKEAQSGNFYRQYVSILKKILIFGTFWKLFDILYFFSPVSFWCPYYIIIFLSFSSTCFFFFLLCEASLSLCLLFICSLLWLILFYY